ncbi:MAG: MSCRAMM family protein [Anaerolineae bacterium]
MDLRDYPRPKNDTGIGVHWSAGYAAAVGLGKIRDFWLPELIAMGVKWVKIANHDGALSFVELLLKNDIMPIVRIYRPQPNPGVLDEKALAAVRNLVSAGVRYIEFNNEPDLGVEWQGRQVPPNAVQVVAQNAIVDMEAILNLGGYPAVPALAPGTKWDLVGEICRLGRRDLFSEPVWQAVHNYSLNHPLDYPYDPGNQQGAPYTAEFYNRLAAEQWDGDAWQGWSLERVNAERQRNANPGATAFDDPACWRSYERYDKLIRDQIGRSLPILSTENGYIVGERPDPRYPATTPQLHMAQTLEACRIMMGTSSRFDHAPDYYFCTAFWLLANYNLGSWAPEWEGQAWYSSRWPEGRLPIVDALKAEPKQVRRWRGEVGISGRISGLVRGGEGLLVRIVRGDGWSLAARVGSDQRYEFTDVPLERYRVIVQEVGKEQEVLLTRERPAATANFDLGGGVVTLANSMVRGVVHGGAGRVVRLSRPADGWTQDRPVAADGSYQFSNLAAGTYTLAVVGTEVRKEGILLDGRNETVADLTVSGWVWEVTDGGASPGFGIVRCRVKGRTGVPVRLWTTGWEGLVQLTGSKAEYGPDACEFAPLGVGRYSVQPQGADIVAEVNVDGRRVQWVTFTAYGGQETAPQPGAIVGTLRRPAGSAATVDGRTVQAIRPPAADPVASAQSAADGSYRLEGLTAGRYTVQVLEAGPGSAVIAQQTDVNVEPAGQAHVDLTLPSAVVLGLRPVVEDGGPGPGFCVVRCRLVGQPGHAVRLWTWGWSGITQLTGTKPEYGPDACEFAPLGPGIYFVELEETDAAGISHTIRAEVRLEPNRVVWVRFEREQAPQPAAPAELPPGPGPQPASEEPHPQPAPEEPGPLPIPGPTASESVIGGTVTYPPGSGLYSNGLLLVLSGPGGEHQTVVSGGQYAFFGLPAGTYRLTVLAPDPALGELAVRDGIVADGTNQVTVDFVLPATQRAESRITGRVKGGAGRAVLLEGPLENQTTPVEERVAVVAQDETYGFDGLGPGTYRTTVLDTTPPSGSTATQAGILLDGTNTARVDFDLDALRPGKMLDHYLLVGSIARSRDDFLATLRYVARFRPVIGSDEVEARQARHVTILGGTSAVSALAEQGLRMSGCQVHRIEGDFAANLGRLLEEGRPY